MGLFASKFSAYSSFVASHRSVIVNLKYVQKSPKEFLEELTSHFTSVMAKEFFQPVVKHTKTKKEFKVDVEEKKRPDELDKYEALEKEIQGISAVWYNDDLKRRDVET